MNLPNKLTLLRIFLIPIFLLIFLISIPYGQYIATAIFIIAASTDGLDGYIARKRKQITNLGKLMDPLADKLLITAALIVLVESGDISGWIAFIIIGREFFVTGLRTIAAAEGVIIAASKLGKLKTISQIVAITVTLLNFTFGIYLMYIAVIFTLWSGIDYYLNARKKIRLKVE
ncbi:MAG: CDP-diacylglycerol--glycerol-3-phosphate 3-phosphatidyltransferase [Peptococcia bacterium]|jgi:CDP-diacylglycerol--glycerol-3-phosphate 3-phosphatidyltransferase